MESSWKRFGWKKYWCDYLLRTCLVGFIVFLIIAIGIDLNYIPKYFGKVREFIYRNTARSLGVSDLVMGTSENDHLMDSFCLVWGMTITIVLFLLEMRDECWHGIRLKTLVGISFKKSTLVLTSTFYILLCPIVYFAETYRLYTTALFGIGVTFIAFLAVPLYVLNQTRGVKVKQVLIWESTEKLRKMILEDREVSESRETESWRWKECGRKKKNDGSANKAEKKYGYIQRELEVLPITSMIEHVDYEDDADVKDLIDTLLGIFQEYDLHDLIQNSVYAHGILTTWMKRILEKIDISTRWGQDCFGYIIAIFWSELYNTMSQKLGGEELRRCMLGYRVECLTPLIRDGSQYASIIFDLVWRQSGEIQPYMICYLFLYAEFRYHECSGILSRDFQNIIDEIQISRYSLRKSSALWDKKLALEFWMSWTEFRDERSNLVMAEFLDFCQDMDYIEKNEMERVRTYTMRRVVLRIGES